MLHAFRQANNMTRARFNNLFIYRSEVLKAGLGPEDTVVFVDDFAGTGDQVTTAWPALQELLAGGPRAILALVAGTGMALARIEEETTLEVMAHTTLDGGANIFATACRHFSPAEKQTLLAYCRIADARFPRGHGDAGLTLVLAHGGPNNSIPVLHKDHPSWRGLFPRHN